MSLTKHIRDGLVVEFSDTAMVSINGRWFNPFQRNSYTARVTYAPNDVRFVVLPEGARSVGSEAHWVDHVVGVANGFGAPNSAGMG